MNQCGQEIKKKLSEYQQQCTLTVEEYSADLREKRDKLEDVWSTLNKRKRGMRDTDVVNDFVSMQTVIDSCPTVRFANRPQLPRMAYIKGVSTGNIMIEFLFMPY